MQQPPSPTNTSPVSKHPAAAEEFLAHYESQGLDGRDAALKAIDDLEALLERSLTSRRLMKDHSMSDTLRKLDKASARLAVVQRKLDSKPSFSQSLALSLASAATVSHVLGGLHFMWDSIQTATKTSLSQSPP